MKNILLLFLSDVKTNNGVISEASYENVEGEDTQITNESAVRYLLKKFPIDKIFIFASKKVRREIAGYSDEEGRPRTHLQFSLERLKKFLPEMDCFVFDYDEYGSDNDNLKSIAEMARHVQKFAESEEVNLHVDLTGGMRHVNMMMLELTRLLEYSGLKVGKVLYSNYKPKPQKGRVEEIQNIYDLFQLMAGVEEFVNFGSVKALEQYYSGKKVSDPLKKLLDAMKNFAEAIKLCHYGQFREAIENLHDAVHDFGKYEPEDVEDILMARLIGRIRKNYRDLIENRNKDDLRIIRWCLENDYLQQALTLYTERIPEYLGEKIITQSETEAKKLTLRVENDDMGRNRFYLLLNAYPSRQNHTDKAFRKFCDAIKSETVGKKNVDVDSWLKSLGDRLASFNVSVKDEPRLRSQIETFNKIRQNPALLCTPNSPELDPIHKIIEKLSPEFVAVPEGYRRRKILFDSVNKLSNENFTDFFPNVIFAKNIFDNYPRAHKIYELLFEKIFFVQIPEEKFLSIMEKYFKIQSERNHSNHARADFGEFKTAESLRKFMSDALEEIKNNLPVK